MSKPTKPMPDEPHKFLEQYPDTRQLELLQPDMLGILRGKRVGREEFAKPFTGGLNFCGATVLLENATDRGVDLVELTDIGGNRGDRGALDRCQADGVVEWLRPAAEHHDGCPQPGEE